MLRPEIYAAIDTERLAQDTKWRIGRPNEAQYKFAAPHVLLLEEGAAKLREDWYNARGEEFRSRLVKIAAVAVRALEEIDAEA